MHFKKEHFKKGDKLGVVVVWGAIHQILRIILNSDYKRDS
jgi:hypothetical protein